MKKLMVALALLSAVNRGLGQQYTSAPADAYQSTPEHLNAAKKQGSAKDNSQPQILLRLRVYEVSRTKLQSLGFDFSRVFSGPVQAESLVKVLDALREEGVASLVSEPNLMTLNNRPASVRVGDHARVAVGLGGGRTGIEDRFCGTSLDFTPVVLDGHTIHLKFHFEKSCPDPTHRITVGRETAPVLDSLVCDKEGDYKHGKTVVLGGPFSRDEFKHQAAVDATAGAALARTGPQAKKTGDLTETLFFVTPEIVSPTTFKTAAAAQTHR